MGHLGNLKQEHRDLVRRLSQGTVGLPEPDDETARRGWQEILEILYTPEDAALAARLPLMPSTVEEIARRVAIAPAALRPRLDAMAERGLVTDFIHPRTGAQRYMLAPPVVGFFEYSLMRIKDGIPKQRMAAALEAYTHGDDAFAREVFGHETVVGRAMVHETALRDDQLPEVLDWERASELVAEARALSVTLCYCRHKAEHLGKRCDAPIDNCLSLNAGADYVVRRGFGRAVERAEAQEILVAARESGLVQIADNVQRRPIFLCNCCGCCCGQLQAINDFNLPAVNPSAFLAESDSARCSGCGRCARACPIGAISMLPQRLAARRKGTLAPAVDADRCIGCGVCVGACRKQAMGMRSRAARPYVPERQLEKSVRMALERGRLADLLVDGGAGRGARLLHRALQVICGLPPAERALASEQLRSRFVGYFLAKAGAGQRRGERPPAPTAG